MSATPTQTKLKETRPAVAGAEVRSFAAEVRLIETEGAKPKIRGYAAVFNSRSQPMTTNDGQTFVETIAPGAFARALPECDVRALFNHDSRYVLGRRAAGTLRLFEDEKGLAYEIDPPDTSYARDLTESLRRGDIAGSSFSFSTIEDDWSEGDEGVLQRQLRAVHTFDVGPVTYPAYRATSASYRSLDAFLEERKAEASRKVQVAFPSAEQRALLNHFLLADFA